VLQRPHAPAVVPEVKQYGVALSHATALETPLSEAHAVVQRPPASGTAQVLVNVHAIVAPG
jgi:hypothetical protein